MAKKKVVKVEGAVEGVQYRYLDNTPFGVKLSIVERHFQGATDTITPDHGKGWDSYLDWVANDNEPLAPGEAWD